MGNLFGHKRWYEVPDKKGFKIKRKVKVKRNYDGNKYILNINENNNKEKIDNNKFIRKYINYKKNDNILNEFTRKFHAGNILFKLKGKEGIIRIENNDDFLETEEVVLYIEAYGKSEKLKALGITKKKIIDEAIRQGITKDNKKIEIKRQENEEEIEIDIRDEYTNKTLNECSIILRIIENDELETKKSIYEIFKNINMSLYKIIEKIIENETEKVFENRYYEEHLREKLLKDNKIDVILTNFMEIREKIKSNLEIMGFVKFYLNVGGDKKKSENKKMLVEKILNINVDLTVEDIADFVIKELEFWNITKRIEKVKKFNNEFIEKRRNRTYIKSYVLLDKHEKFKIERENKKDKIVKLFVENIKNNSIKEKIKKILAEFKIDELIKKLEKELKRGNCDTEIFGIFKKHYKVNFDSKKFSKKSDEEKELYKIIYRYLKGRIEKILVNEQKVRLKKMKKIEIEKILNESILSEKILKRVKQYTLEHIMYLGKLRHNDIDMTTVNTDDFSRLHAKEELDLELITFFASTNMELNKIFNGKEKITDFFGFNLNGQKITLKEKVPNFKLNILKKLNFINNENKVKKEEFISKFITIGVNERNRILHSNSKEIAPKGKQDDYNKVINIIQNLKISDEEVSKALNLDVVFKNKKDIITKINDIKISEENSNDIKYLPSFSKILPEILNLYRNNPKNEPFDTIETEKIVLNALIYVNKELYKKLILEDDLEENGSKNIFLQELKKTLGNVDEIDENIIENYYKNAQISASKGNNKAIKKYQKKIIECYIEYLRKNYEKLFDFSDFEMNIQEIKKQIKEINDNKTYKRITINTSDKSIVINNDFEYIISIFALLNNNIVINKIRNRFFATSVWLNTSEYQNIIDILDEIMQINILKSEYITSNWKENLEEFIRKTKNKEIELHQSKKEFFDNNYKEIKKDIVNGFQDNEEIKKIFDDNLKEIIDFRNNGIMYFKNLKELSQIERKFIIDNKKLFEDKIDEIIIKKQKEIKEEILSKKIFNSEFLEKYKEIIDNLTKNENKFEKIYYPKEHKNELYIYKKNLFLNIGNPNFDKIYGLISKDIKNVDTKILFDDDIRKNKISEIDAILKNLNDKLNGYSNDYKAKYVNKLKENDDFFAKNIQNENYSSFGEFEKDYNKVSEYKKIRDLVEFNYLNKIESYLIDINWKLAIQMARFERDMHYIVNGLRELGIIKLSGYNTGISRAYPKRNGSDGFYTTTAYYKFFDEESYKKFEKICYGFGIDLSENSEINKPENESIRNYISHFYIVRNPFVDYSIAEQIDRVSNLLSYSTRYNNSTYASVFEVFKKDVNLDYDKLKTKFKLFDDEKNDDIKILKIEDLIESKKVSVLELESYNPDYIKNLIIELLTKIENTNDTLEE